MPVELRHILFRPAEIVLALGEFSRRTGTPLPPGSVVSSEVRSVVEDGTELVRFAMVIETDGAAAPGAARRREIITGGATLAAALILFCRDRRIPLPSDAAKSLRQFGDQLALVVTRNPKQQAIPPIG